VTLKGISEKTAYFTVVEDNNRPCPICLSQDTKIDMISGQVMVQDVKVGDKVWSIDEKGKSFIATVIMLGKTQVPSTHVVTHITLAGKRNVTASPNHPTIDGRTVGDLNVGDILDGSKIIKVETLPYKYAYTYDILTSGETGTYFAGGIPLGSTLSK
jgi:hypothetical protein